MSLSKNINEFRRGLMHKLTKNIGNSHQNRNVDLKDKVEIKRVLISRPNHRLGNLLLITPLIQEVISTFPDCKIDLFIKGYLAPTVFKNYKNINNYIELPRKPFKQLIKYTKVWVSIKRSRYDLVINGDKNSSSGRLSTQFSNATYKVFGDVNEEIQLKYKDYEHIAKYPIYNLRNYLTKIGIRQNEDPIPTLNIKLSASGIKEGKKILKDIVKNDKETICLFTNATGDKCYSESWWGIFYERLKVEYPNYNIIELLPIENISKILFKAPTFYSKDIREMGSLIANTKIFITADNGVMHLASSVQTPTVGFFSVTNQNVYEPYGNKSVAINTNTSEINEWFKIINKILTDN